MMGWRKRANVWRGCTNPWTAAKRLRSESANRCIDRGCILVGDKLVSEPPIAVPDEHAQLVEADQRFRAALGQAIAAGGERIEAVEATVQLKRRTRWQKHVRHSYGLYDANGRPIRSS
jgi:hypothetical protein